MKVVARNKRAKFEYDISDTLRAGLVLFGSETKSARSGHVSLKGSFVNIKDGELWANNIHISAYARASKAPDYDPLRPRKLLVTDAQRKTLIAARLAGKNIVPLSMLAGRYIKIEIGMGASKKLRDKRQVIQKRQAEREANRQLSSNSMPLNHRRAAR